MNPYYPNLLSPIKIGPVTLKNRICLAPMNLREVDHNGGYTARTIAFNEKFAKGGVALITMGEACVSQKTGSSESFMLRITNPGAYFSLRPGGDCPPLGRQDLHGDEPCGRPLHP